MLEDTYNHTPVSRMFNKDYYGIGFNEEYAAKKKIHLGIIGTGGISQSKHIPAINRLKTLWKQIEIVAFSVRNENQGRKITDIYKYKWYPDYKEMLKNEKLDGVIIASPDRSHFEHTMACLDLGINVLLEKPFTTLLSEGKELCEFAEKKNLVLMTVSNKRYSSPYRRARQFVDIGPVKNPAMFCGKFNHGLEGGHHFEDATIHIFDLARFFMGDVSEIYSIGIHKYKRTNYPFDNAITNIKFKSGSIGSIYTTTKALCLKPWERVEIYADHSWLEIEDQDKLILYDSEKGPSKSWNPIIASTMVFDEEVGGYMGLIDNFVEVIRGNEKPLVTGWDGFKACEVVAASHLSIIENTAIKIPLDVKSADSELIKWLDFLK
ncbi:MAG: Gfo/Idh/MocA family protein [Candidatus Humimicrobiaceae bacterium]